MEDSQLLCAIPLTLYHSLTMRIKVALLAPFTTSKILLPVSETIQTISHLKKHIHSSLSAVSKHATSWREIKLEIDGFELLAGSQVDIIEDGDVVSCVYP